MPQGKLKVKTKGGQPPPKKTKPPKKFHGVKKGKLVFAPKKQVTLLENNFEQKQLRTLLFTFKKTYTRKLM